MATEVINNTERGRYEILVDDELAGHVRYRVEDGRVVLVHTEVEPGHEGAGLGSKLARFALDDVRERGLAVLPECTFIAGFIRSHPEYLDLVVPERRGQVGGEQEGV